MKLAIRRHHRAFQQYARHQRRKRGTVPMVAEINYGVESDRYYANPDETFEDFANFIRRTAAKCGSWLTLIVRPFDPAVDPGWLADHAFVLEIFPHSDEETSSFPVQTGAN